jgi:response regulator RpfG family c-di-GMP phosphodiesterase
MLLPRHARHATRCCLAAPRTRTRPKRSSNVWRGHAAELLRAHETTAFALTKLVEARDPSTGVHLERVRAYAKLLATTLAHAPRWRGTLDERFVSAVHTASPLHDIGKVGIADMILLKPGKLDTRRDDADAPARDDGRQDAA